MRFPEEYVFSIMDSLVKIEMAMSLSLLATKSVMASEGKESFISDAIEILCAIF